MRFTNRDELHPWRSTGPGSMPATTATDAPAPAQAASASTSTSRHSRRLGQCSRQAHVERRRAACAATRGDVPPPTGTATSPVGEHAMTGSQFPYGMRNAATTYTSSISTNVASYEDLPGHHLLAVRNLIATTNDESYHSSTSELPPATSQDYTEWEFSGVSDPVTFQRFLDTVDYWLSCSDDSSIGSYDPAHECFVVVVDEHTDDANRTGVGDTPRTRSRTHLPPRRREAPTSPRSWPRHVSLRLSSWRSTGRCDSCAPPSREKLQHVANVCKKQVGGPASASTLTSTSMTRTHRLVPAKSSSQRQHCFGPCPSHRRPWHVTCAAMSSSNKRLCSRPRALRPAYVTSPTCGTTVTHTIKRRPSMWVAQRGSRQPRAKRLSGSRS
jgi:hypothetical protein